MNRFNSISCDSIESGADLPSPVILLTHQIRARRPLRSWLSIASLLFVWAQVPLLADPVGEVNLILDMKTALANSKPIYDCAGLDHAIRRVWPAKCRPCNEPSRHAVVAFKVGKTAEPYDIRLVRSAGTPACDRIDQQAIQDAKLFFIPTGDAEVVFDFNFVPGTYRPRGSAIVLAPGKQDPPVIFVQHSGSFHRQFNNEGVSQLLDGDYPAAQHSFEESLKCDSTYEPAAHNLKLVSELVKKLPVKSNYW